MSAKVREKINTISFFKEIPVYVSCACPYSFTEKELPLYTGSLYKSVDTHARKVQQQALAGMFGMIRN